MQSPLKDSLSGLATRLMQRHILLASGLGVVACMLGFQWLKTQLGAPTLDELQGYDQMALREHLLLYGEAGRALHAGFTLSLDMVFPIVYGAFFGGLLALMGPRAWLPFALFPVFGVMILDVAENLQLAVLLYGFPDLTVEQIDSASQTTQAKFMAIQFMLLWLLGLTLLRLYKRFRR
jgi:hypothetical protein